MSNNKTKSRVATKILTVVALAVSIVAGCVFLYDYAAGKDDPFTLFFCDEEGFARTGLLVETPDGERKTEDNGKLVCPVSWHGKDIDIFLLEPRCWLKTVKLFRPKNGQTVRIIIPPEVAVESGTVVK